MSTRVYLCLQLFTRACLPMFTHYYNKEHCITFKIWSLLLSDTEWPLLYTHCLPFSNLAADEAHESVINRRMKAITSRPSAFRTVELADFMSYLDTILVGFESYVLQNNSTPKQHYKMYVSQRVPIVRQLLLDNNVVLFSNNLNETVPLRNIFVSKSAIFRLSN